LWPRSLAVFALLCAGLVIGREAAGLNLPAAAWFSVAAGLCAAAVVASGQACRALLAIATVSLGAGWFTFRTLEHGPGWLPSIVGSAGPGSPAIVRAEGIVLADPAPALLQRTPLIPPLGVQDRWRASLSVDHLHTDGEERVPARGIVLLRGGCRDPAGPRFRAGDRIILTGEFRASPAPQNPGERDRRLWHSQEGVAGTLRTADLATATFLPMQGTAEEVRAQLLRIRADMSSRARVLLLGDEPRNGSRHGPDGREPRALLAALILGEEDPALAEVRSAFQRLGLVHLLSISGFHLMVLALAALLVVRAAGDLGWIEPLILALLLGVYLTVLPVHAPVWRAALMLLVLMAADALGRRYDRLATLGWIACGMLLWRPMDLWSIGFQLSFGLVAVLIRFGPIAHERLWGIELKGTLDRPQPGALRWCGREVKKLTATNALCSTAAAPLVLYHVGLVSPLAVVAGVVAVIPVVALMAAGYLAVLIGLLAPPLAGAMGDVLSWLGAVVIWVVRILDMAPGASLRGPPVSLAWAAAATGLILYWFARGYWRQRRVWAAAAALGAWLGAEAWMGPRVPAATLRVDAIAVGDGSCYIVRSGREAILWDCGSLGDGPGVGRLTLPRAARELGVRRIPTVIITHPNLDHYNGVLDAAEPLGITQVLIGRAFEEAGGSRPGPEAYFLEELARRRIQVRTVGAGDRIGVGRARLELISPSPDERFTLDNDMSLVARVSHPDGRGSVVLCGDIQDDAIASLRDRLANLAPAVMEAPHHGSARAAAIEWVSDLNPAVVLQSSGPSRAGDPRWEHVRQGRRWLCTATEGAVWAELRPDGSVRTGSWAGHRRTGR
jgi:competence protein ComEC